MATNHSVVKDIQSDGKTTRFPVEDRKSHANDYAAGLVSDEEIDQNYKIILRSQRNGAYLSPEIVAHLEYFVNTLSMKHRRTIVNPFEKVAKYPALLFKGISKVESFSNGTGPTQPHEEVSSESEDGGVTGDIIDEPTMVQEFMSKSAEAKADVVQPVASLRRVSIKNEVAK